ncbi:MAG: DUF6629 family protein [Cyanobacteria bacterium J06638_7]
MCFSASASFTAAAVLMPMGIYSIHIARTIPRRGYEPLAAIPLFFGLQQFVEGLVWTGLDSGRLEPLTTAASVGFLFFAYCFWMIWVPWSAYAISAANEPPARSRRLRWVWIIASVLGIGFFLPVLIHPPLVQPNVFTDGRITYQVQTVLHNFINTEPLGQLLYWGFIVAPLVALRDPAVKLFGVLIFVSIFLTWFTYSQAFNSVWCFYCAILSIVVIWIVNRPVLRDA